jgi:hypothetical protein
MVDLPRKTVEDLSQIFQGLSHSAKISAADIYALTGNLKGLQDTLGNNANAINSITGSFDHSTIALNKMVAMFGTFPEIAKNVNTEWKDMITSLQSIDFKEQKSALSAIVTQSRELAKKVTKESAPGIIEKFSENASALTKEIDKISSSSESLKSIYGEMAVSEYLKTLIKLRDEMVRGSQIDIHDTRNLGAGRALDTSIANVKQLSAEGEKLSDTFDQKRLGDYATALKKVDLSFATMEIQNNLFSKASQNLVQKSKALPGILGSIGEKAASGLASFSKTGVELSQFGPRLSGMVSGFKDFFKALPPGGMLGPGALALVVEIFKLFRRGLALASSMTQALGPAAFTLRDLGDTLRNITGAGFSGVLALKDTESILKLIGTTLKNELYPAGIFVGDKLTQNAVNIAMFAEHIDTFASGIGTTGDDMMKKLLRTSSLLNTKLTGIGSQLAQYLTDQWARLNQMALSGMGLTFEAITDMSKNTFDAISFMGVQTSKTATEGTLAFLGTLQKALVSTNKDIAWNMQQLRTAYQSILTGIEQTSWETYYGVLAMGGKLSNNLEADLEKVFSTSPLERFIETYKTMQKIGEGAGVGNVWTALTHTLGKIPDTLVVPITKALNSMNTSQLDALVKNPELFWNNLLAGQGVSPDEITKLQRTTGALEDPLKTISTLVKKIYDLLAGWATTMTLGWFKK